MFEFFKNLGWEDVKSPVYFASGMLVGVILVAIIWYLVQCKKAHGKRQREREDGCCDDSQHDGEGEDDDDDDSDVEAGGGRRDGSLARGPPPAPVLPVPPVVPEEVLCGVGGGAFPSAALIVADPAGDYLFEDKSQLGGIIDFRKVPRREAERQAARRELVITMLIAESMSK